MAIEHDLDIEDELLDRAAKALVESYNQHPGIMPVPWEHMDESLRDLARRNVIAVLKTVGF